MNRKILTIGSMLCLFLTGCSSASTSASASAVSSSVEEETEEVTYAADTYLVFHQACFSNNGYFYFDASGFNYVDLADMTNYPIEQHQSADIGDQYMGTLGLTWFYDGKVCYSKIQEDGAYIGFYMCDRNGENETEFSRYSVSDALIASIGSKGILYKDTAYISISSSAGTEVLCAIDMKSGEIREITPLVSSDGTVINICFVYQDALYFTSRVELETNAFTDYYNLYRYDLNSLSTTLLRNDLNYTFNADTMPSSQYIYYGSENTAQNGQELKFYEYDLSTNEIHTISFTYALNENEYMWFASMFNDFAIIRVSDNEGTYTNTIFYHPQTGETEYYSQDASFIPSAVNDTYVLGYTYDASENYLFSLLTTAQFSERAFDKAIKVMK